MGPDILNRLDTPSRETTSVTSCLLFVLLGNTMKESADVANGRNGYPNPKIKSANGYQMLLNPIHISYNSQRKNSECTKNYLYTKEKCHQFNFHKTSTLPLQSVT